MAEKDEDGASKAFEVVPLFFFDLIARVVPGLFLLFGLNLLSDGKLLQKVVESTLPEKAQDSAFVSSAAALLAGYIVGHLMSPFVKAFDNWYHNSVSGVKDDSRF